MSLALVAYYSYSGATRRLAEEIARQTGAALLTLTPETPYAFDHNTAIRELRNEIERGFCPKLVSDCEAAQKCEIVFVGSPNWLNRFAPPVLSFLRQTDLAGKTVVPFCTSGGGGLGRMAEDFKRECPRSALLDGLQAAADFTPAEVSAFLTRIGLSRH